jgi:Sigma-70 region 2
MTDSAWIDAALTSARPQAVGALLRYFRDLDTAEEAFQNACLRALKSWPQNGPPRDPAAWLIMVGRNVRCPKTPRSPISTMPRARWPNGSTARIIAMTSCGCCSSAAIPICRRRSRLRWRCASSPA